MIGASVVNYSLASRESRQPNVAQRLHISYELNACVRDVQLYRETLSELLGAIQHQFAAANIEILSPCYHAIRNGNHSTVPGLQG